MVKFFSKIRTAVTGENERERLERRTAEQIIRGRERQAMFIAKREEGIKFAQSKQRILREERERRLRDSFRQRPSSGLSSGLRSNLGNPFGNFGQGMGMGQPQQQQNRNITKRVRVPIKTRRIKHRRRPVTQNNLKPQRFDVLGI